MNIEALKAIPKIFENLKNEEIIIHNKIRSYEKYFRDIIKSMSYFDKTYESIHYLRIYHDKVIFDITDEYEEIIGSYEIPIDAFVSEETFRNYIIEEDERKKEEKEKWNKLEREKEEKVKWESDQRLYEALKLKFEGENA